MVSPKIGLILIFSILIVSMSFRLIDEKTRYVKEQGATTFVARDRLNSNYDSKHLTYFVLVSPSFRKTVLKKLILNLSPLVRENTFKYLRAA